MRAARRRSSGPRSPPWARARRAGGAGRDQPPAQRPRPPAPAAAPPADHGPAGAWRSLARAGGPGPAI